MKKIFVMLLVSGLSVPAFAQTAVIRELSGTVEVRRSPASGWTRAGTGMSLEPGMSISTGFRSTALIELGNSSIAVRPLTRMSIEELAASQNSEDVTLFLRAGQIRAKVIPPAEGKSNFQVRSPVITASVRGTEFDMDSSNVKMYSGTVAFAGSDGVPVMVGAGQSGYADAAAQVSADLNPALPLGILPEGGRTAVLVSSEGGVTARVGWYGQNP
jgi:hypothetical protein